MSEYSEWEYFIGGSIDFKTDQGEVISLVADRYDVRTGERQFLTKSEVKEVALQGCLIYEEDDYE